MVSARSYFAKMNESRDNNWLTEDQLLRGTQEFFRINDYSNIEYNKILSQGSRTFSSPVVASKKTKYEDKEINETIVSIFKSKIKPYDLSFIGYIESIVFDVMDNYEMTNVMLTPYLISLLSKMKKLVLQLKI
jgi:hypothetical protein